MSRDPKATLEKHKVSEGQRQEGVQAGFLPTAYFDRDLNITVYDDWHVSGLWAAGQHGAGELHAGDGPAAWRPLHQGAAL